jgi:sugar phosphate permease
MISHTTISEHQCNPVLAHYIIPTMALIFGAVFLMMGITTGAWIFYTIGGIVILLSSWGFNAAHRYIHQHTPVTELTDTGALKIQQNPLQAHNEDPVPPV